MIQFQDFFREKFEFDLHANLRWCDLLSAHEDTLPTYVVKSMSHIINVHHIWNCRLMQQPAESSDWDLLPFAYWPHLLRDNFRKTTDYLDHQSAFEKINYHDSEGVPMEKEAMDILYHVLNHSNYHRAQIAKCCKDANLPVANTNFIVFK